jgi:hypothetical protein
VWDVFIANPLVLRLVRLSVRSRQILKPIDFLSLGDMHVLQNLRQPIICVRGQTTFPAAPAKHNSELPGCPP